MKIAGWITLIYGLLILVGGWMGHVKAASTASLVMGVIFGVLLLLTSLACFKNKLYGLYSSLTLAVILDAFFTYRFTLTQKWMPAGVMALVSITVLLSLALLLRKVAGSKRHPN